MVNIPKQIDYWRNGALQDIEVAEELIGNARYSHGLFFLHLALEKILKAHVCRDTKDFAPKIHNLVILAQKTNLTLSENQLDVLSDMNIYNIEGRYSDMLGPLPKKEEAYAQLNRSKPVFEWLKNQL